MVGEGGLEIEEIREGLWRMLALHYSRSISTARIASTSSVPLGFERYKVCLLLATFDRNVVVLRVVCLLSASHIAPLTAIIPHPRQLTSQSTLNNTPVARIAQKVRVPRSVRVLLGLTIRVVLRLSSCRAVGFIVLLSVGSWDSRG
jgi:hypothetical protein